MKKKRLMLVSLSVLVFFPLTQGFGATPPATDMEICMLEALKTASGNTTVNELRRKCENKLGVDGATELESDAVQTVQTTQSNTELGKPLYLDDRGEQDEQELLPKPFTLLSHKPNYILFATYNANGFDSDLYQEQYQNSSITNDNTESQFQFSVKLPLVVKILGKNIDLFTAYTNISFWQVYNKRLSSPFRETNHEPEIWLQHRPKNLKKFGFTNTLNRIGFTHQSNGQSGVLSRSWNRLYASMLFKRDDMFFQGDTFTFSIKPWFRIPEKSEDDDNSDITDYLGHGQIRIGYKYGNNTFSFLLRNHLESGFKRGAIEAGWSFPLWGKYNFLKGYIRYFTGYGQSLINYDHYVNSIGFGLLLTDIL